MSELVSVIIPTYNREKTIEKAVNSVLAQTYDNLEVIVVDDCSKDDTEKVVRGIKDHRVSYYRLEKNSGACVARNHGVSKATGTIIAFQDSDDVWDPNKLQREVDYLIKNDLEFISCGFRRVYEDGHTEDLGRATCSDVKSDNWCLLIDNNWVSTQTIVCRKYCFEKIHFDKSLRRYQDWDLALQASVLFKMGSLNESLVDVYLQGDSITRTVNSDESKLAVIRKHESDIEPGNKKMLSHYLAALAYVERKNDKKAASGHYWKSFILEPKAKTFSLWFLTATGLVKVRDKRKNSR